MSIISQDSSANTPESPRGSTERPIKVKPERSRCSIPISPGSTGNFYAGKKYSNDKQKTAATGSFAAVPWREEDLFFVSFESHGKAD